MRNTDLKLIRHQGIDYYYISETMDDFDSYYENTDFYASNDVYKVVFKYPLLHYFGFSDSTTLVECNEFLFRLNIDIESCDYTKKDIRRKIDRKVELLNRKKEIKKGEII